MTQTVPPEPPRDLRALPDPADPRATAEAILFEVRRVIVGQDAMLERILVGLLSGGHILLEGVPGLAKTLTIKTLADVLGGSFKRIQFTPGPDAVRPRRDAHLPPRRRRLRDRARPGLRQLPARRRDQPRPGQGPVARCSRSCRSTRSRSATTTYPGPDAVPRPGHREPDRGRGHLPAARGAGRPVHAQDPARLPERRPRRRRSSPARCARASPPREILDAEGLLAPAATRRRRLRRPADHQLRGRPRRGHPQARPTGAPPSSSRTSSYGASPRGSINLIHGARALALLRGRRYVLPSDVAELAPDVLRHRLVLSYAALTDGITAGHRHRARPRPRPGAAPRAGGDGSA